MKHVNSERQKLERQYNELCDSFDMCVGCPHRDKRNSPIGCDEDAMSDTELSSRVQAMAKKCKGCEAL